MADNRDRTARLESVVHAALERPEGARDAYLAEACGGDEELQREAISLLRRAGRAEGFLGMPLGALAVEAMTCSAAAPSPVGDLPISIGSRVGGYEVRERLGAGGMGVVYRAHDCTLGRDVAIKVLPEAFSANPDRLARFEREARLLASLNHPHLAAVYGLEKSDERHAIVLEFIDGETLETRLTRGPISTIQAVALAIQIADALDHAHSRGVTHRDLKPANIMLTRSGAKLLDFGLAKWSPRGYVPSPDADQPARPERSENLTGQGTILGTLHYMAPEQLEGKPVDSRADVFAFGAVLYEMLTGRKAFDGGSAAAVMAAVLNLDAAPLSAVQPGVSRSLERLIHKCLAKDPDERWQTARDLADELRWIASDGRVRPAPAEPDHPSAPSIIHARSTRLLRIAALVAIAAAVVYLAVWNFSRSRESSPSRAVTRFVVEPSATPNHGFDISPDGATVVYSAGPLGNFRLFFRRFNQFSDHPIAGTEGATAPVFSPDGQWVAFFAGGKLMKVNVQTAAAPVLLCSDVGAELLNGAVWLEDGTIVFAQMKKGLQRVSAEGGEPAPFTSLTQTPAEYDHHSPSFLPGGETLLFTEHASDGRFNVVAQSLTSGERKILIASAYDASYVPSGQLVFARNQTLLAVPFDARRLEVTGPAVVLVEDVDGAPIDGYGGYRIAQNGTLVFRPQRSQDGRTLVWVDRSGMESPVALAPRAFGSPRVSPDGKRVAFAVADGSRRDIWTYDLPTERLARLTREGDNRTPVWTRDGERLVFASQRGNEWQLLSQSADGSSAPERLVSGGSLLLPGTWSADGRTLFYTDGDTGPAGTYMSLVRAEKDSAAQPFLRGPHQQRQPNVSPDGRWIAFTSSETGRFEVYIAAFPGLSARQVSVDGGREPLWSRDGRELVYRSGTRMFSVAVDTSRGFSAGKPMVLFDAGYVQGGIDVGGHDYDLAPDGRFLMVKASAEEHAPPGLHVVVNWVDELKQRVPLGK